MKKSLLTIISLIILAVSANAAGYTGNCLHWEHGDVIKINGVPINTPSTAPPAFCWEPLTIESEYPNGAGYYSVNGSWYSKELLSNGSSTILDWFALEQKYVYGEMQYGIYVTVGVFGFPQNIPTVKIGYHTGQLITTTNEYSISGSILNGHIYKFFIPYIPVANAVYFSDVDIHDNLLIYDGATLKSITPIK